MARPRPIYQTKAGTRTTYRRKGKKGKPPGRALKRSSRADQRSRNTLKHRQRMGAHTRRKGR